MGRCSGKIRLDVTRIGAASGLCHSDFGIPSSNVLLVMQHEECSRENNDLRIYSGLHTKSFTYTFLITLLFCQFDEFKITRALFLMKDNWNNLFLPTYFVEINPFCFIIFLHIQNKVNFLKLKFKNIKIIKFCLVFCKLVQNSKSICSGFWCNHHQTINLRETCQFRCKIKLEITRTHQ